ncbi:MAG TPA: DUF3341 domain-containing protein [Stellaceae bacterium]|jgi:hypothetical protein|nr:DUF3341 domain-containing protein [Stellaceae bacterium]
MSGIALEFPDETPLVQAAQRLRERGVRAIEAYTPYPVEALDALLPLPRNLLPALVFATGMLGLAGGFLLQWYGAAISYPMNIGGRPPASWPAFIPIAFEIAVLCAVTMGFVGFFALAGLPKPYQPIHALPGFERATQDRFFLVVDVADPHFDSADIDRLSKEITSCRVVAWPS